MPHGAPEILKDGKYSKSYSYDPRYAEMDPKQKAELKKRETTERVQRANDGKYCILERILTPEELEKRDEQRLVDMTKEDPKNSLADLTKEDPPASRTDNNIPEGLGNKSECNEIATTESESLVEPLVRSVESVQPVVSLSEKHATDSDDDSDSPTEYWDESDSSEGEGSEEKQEVQAPQVQKKIQFDDFTVNINGALFGSKVKANEGFELPEPASSEHFKIEFVDNSFHCHAMDPNYAVAITRLKHHIRGGDCIEFLNEERVTFTDVQQDEDKIEMGANYYIGGTSKLGTLEIPKGGVQIGFAKGCGIQLNNKKTSMKDILATLTPHEQNGVKDLVLEADSSENGFKVCLFGEGDTKEAGALYGSTCPLDTGDLVSIPEAPHLKYKVTVCIEPRTEERYSHSHQWTSVKDCKALEDPNFNEMKEQQDRSCVRDGLSESPSTGLFAIFDGHGGRDVADVAAATLPSILEQELKLLKKEEEETDVFKKPHVRKLTSMSIADIPNAKTLNAKKQRSVLRGFFGDRDAKRRQSGEVARSYIEDFEMVLGEERNTPVNFYEASDVIRGPLLAIKKSCQRVAALMHGMINEAGFYQGSTAQVCLLRKDPKTGVRTLHCASIGDSGAILIRNGNPVEVSTISRHKPDHKEEKIRIERARGRVRDGRLMNMLAVSRAFGDLSMAEWGLISEPHFSETEIGTQDSHLVVASDGVWDYINSKRVAEVVTNATCPESACHDIVNVITSGKGKQCVDNIAIIIAELNHDDIEATGSRYQPSNRSVLYGIAETPISSSSRDARGSIISPALSPRTSITTIKDRPDTPPSVVSRTLPPQTPTSKGAEDKQHK
mmetsp:Transcript_10596/g.25902  ORF Transcript_10596/g.25902 Transcript_10596/m.25902 type:complete len:839 (+) Transcript_10596:248-2764(+)